MFVVWDWRSISSNEKMNSGTISKDTKQDSASNQVRVTWTPSRIIIRTTSETYHQPCLPALDPEICRWHNVTANKTQRSTASLSRQARFHQRPMRVQERPVHGAAKLLSSRSAGESSLPCDPACSLRERELPQHAVGIDQATSWQRRTWPESSRWQHCIIVSLLIFC